MGLANRLGLQPLDFGIHPPSRLFRREGPPPLRVQLLPDLRIKIIRLPGFQDRLQPAAAVPVRLIGGVVSVEESAAKGRYGMDGAEVFRCEEDAADACPPGRHQGRDARGPPLVQDEGSCRRQEMLVHPSEDALLAGDLELYALQIGRDQVAGESVTKRVHAGQAQTVRQKPNSVRLGSINTSGNSGMCHSFLMGEMGIGESPGSASHRRAMLVADLAVGA